MSGARSAMAFEAMFEKYEANRDAAGDDEEAQAQAVRAARRGEAIGELPDFAKELEKEKQEEAEAERRWQAYLDQEAELKRRREALAKQQHREDKQQSKHHDTTRRVSIDLPDGEPGLDGKPFLTQEELEDFYNEYEAVAETAEWRGNTNYIPGYDAEGGDEGEPDGEDEDAEDGGEVEEEEEDEENGGSEARPVDPEMQMITDEINMEMRALFGMDFTSGRLTAVKPQDKTEPAVAGSGVKAARRRSSRTSAGGESGDDVTEDDERETQRLLSIIHANDATVDFDQPPSDDEPTDLHRIHAPAHLPPATAKEWEAVERKKLAMEKRKAEQAERENRKRQEFQEELRRKAQLREEKTSTGLAHNALVQIELKRKKQELKAAIEQEKKDKESEERKHRLLINRDRFQKAQEHARARKERKEQEAHDQAMAELELARQAEAKRRAEVQDKKREASELQHRITERRKSQQERTFAEKISRKVRQEQETQLAELRRQRMRAGLPKPSSFTGPQPPLSTPEKGRGAQGRPGKAASSSSVVTTPDSQRDSITS